MTKKQIIKKIEASMNEITEKINDYSIDFLDDYAGLEVRYLRDLIDEFADNNISVYYSDQRKYYNDHYKECNDALLNYGYDLNELLKECGDLDGIICRAGAIGEYDAIYTQLIEDEKAIIEYLRLYNLLQIINELSIKKIEKYFENILFDCSGCDYGYIPLIKEDFERAFE